MLLKVCIRNMVTVRASFLSLSPQLCHSPWLSLPLTLSLSLLLYLSPSLALCLSLFPSLYISLPVALSLSISLPLTPRSCALHLPLSSSFSHTLSLPLSLSRPPPPQGSTYARYFASHKGGDVLNYPFQLFFFTPLSLFAFHYIFSHSFLSLSLSLSLSLQYRYLSNAQYSGIIVMECVTYSLVYFMSPLLRITIVTIKNSSRHMCYL